MTDCTLCSWRIRSALPLPEAMPWSGPDRAVDIEIRRGPVRRKRPKDRAAPRRIEVMPSGEILYDARPHARFLVTPSSVVVDSHLPAEAPEWRVFLLGPILGLLCYLRGALPLHASAIRMGAHAVAFAGSAGAGKSTLAAALVQRRHPLITDDICPVVRAGNESRVLPTFPALKLGSASLEVLGIASGGLAQIGFGEGKYLLARHHDFEPSPLPLRRVYLLEEAPPASRERIVRVRGIDVFERLSAEVYRSEIGRLMYTKSALFIKLAEVASGIEVCRLLRRPGLPNIDHTAALVEADLAAP